MEREIQQKREILRGRWKPNQKERNRREWREKSNKKERKRRGGGKE